MTKLGLTPGVHGADNDEKNEDKKEDIKIDPKVLQSTYIWFPLDFSQSWISISLSISQIVNTSLWVNIYTDLHS